MHQLRQSRSGCALDQGDVAQTQEFLGQLPGAQIAHVEEYTVGGAEGVRFEVSHDVGVASGGTQLDRPSIGVTQIGDQYPLGIGQSVVTIVDVDGTTVTLVYQGSTGGSPSEIANGYETFMDEGLAIIDSIVWESIG